MDEKEIKNIGRQSSHLDILLASLGPYLQTAPPQMWI